MQHSVMSRGSTIITLVDARRLTGPLPALSPPPTYPPPPSRPPHPPDPALRELQRMRSRYLPRHSRATRGGEEGRRMG